MLFFLFLLKNIDWGEAVLTSTHNQCFEEKYEIYQSFFIRKNSFFLFLVKFSIYLNRHVVPFSRYVICVTINHNEIMLNTRVSIKGNNKKSGIGRVNGFGESGCVHAEQSDYAPLHPGLCCSCKDHFVILHIIFISEKWLKVPFYPKYSTICGLLALVLLNPDKPCLCKQCRSGSVGFCRSQLIWICTVCH